MEGVTDSVLDVATSSAPLNQLDAKIFIGVKHYVKRFLSFGETRMQVHKPLLSYFCINLLQLYILR